MGKFCPVELARHADGFGELAGSEGFFRIFPHGSPNQLVAPPFIGLAHRFVLKSMEFKH